MSETRPSLMQVLAQHRLVVCVGMGGVGKTTVAAALGLLGAFAGRRTMVLTIDPARQLARALGLSASGLDELLRKGEEVSLEGLRVSGRAPTGSVHAAMLDQKSAWDAFITRHAPNAAVRDTLLDNRFYRQLSTSFAGSFELMAIEELCRLDESGAYDLIVIDTPPAAAAIDFLRAPERIAHLLQPDVARFLAQPYRSGDGGPWSAFSSLLTRTLFRLERIFGSRMLREISAFFVAIEALLGDIDARIERARSLLRSEQTAFVVITGAEERTLSDGAALAATMRTLGVSLRATIANRLHPLPSGDKLSHSAIEALLAELAAQGVDLPTQDWLRVTWRSASQLAQWERKLLGRLKACAPAQMAWAELPELDHDAHSLADLVELMQPLERAGL